MLLLTRRPQESIVINTSDGPIEILIASLNKSQSQVRLGFIADKSIEIWRKEIKEKIDNGE